MESNYSLFPAINASLNALAALLLFVGRWLITRGRKEAHRRVMTGAFLVSALFLASYLYYHWHAGSTPFTGQGWTRPLYFTILISHVVLATLMAPFILRLLWLARKGQFPQHARLARWVWPTWMYTSVTGVLVYFMLYHWFRGEI